MVPTDIIDHILSFLQSDPVSLKTCAQSHPILSKIAERHIYANTTILSDYHSGIVSDEHCLRVCELSKTLSDNPYIANYVRSLEIRFEPGADEDLPLMYYLTKVLPLLALLVSLRKVALIPTGKQEDVRLSSMSRDMLMTFLLCLRLPSMVEVHLENFVLDDTLLHRCQTLKILTLSQCLWYPTGLTYTEDPLYPPRLKSLSIVNCNGEFLHDSCPWVQTLALRSFSLLRLGDSTSLSYSSLPRILSGCASFLNHLDLDFANKSAYHGLTPKFKVLIVYTVHSRYRFTVDSMEPPDAICKSVINLSLPCLERLTLHAELNFHEFRDHLRSMNYWVLWSPLPEMLQLIKSSPSLKQLFLDFRYSFCCRSLRNVDCLRVTRADDVWFPLLALATECLPLSIKICTRVSYCDVGGSNHARDTFFSSISECPRLVHVMEKGVVVEVVEATES